MIVHVTSAAYAHEISCHRLAHCTCNEKAAEVVEAGTIIIVFDMYDYKSTLIGHCSLMALLGGNLKSVCVKKDCFEIVE